MEEISRSTNRLAQSKSPYLLQHQYNPVDWWPWIPEALERAKSENRLIFLSIGYSACHWCHVMEKESFEDPDIASILNKHFISIKVDREERPDIDHIYMAAAQALTGHGGWPLSVFLTPELKPFFAGTYFPAESKHGIIGFKYLLTQIAENWKYQRERIDYTSMRITEHLKDALEFKQRGPCREIHAKDLATSFASRAQIQFDPLWGGFGKAPKFPPTGTIGVLLRHYYQSKDSTCLTMVTKTLDAMCSGGIYDHVGGGFHRYSVDAEWKIPHFEKMLYDNALIFQNLLEAYQITRKETYLKTANHTFNYILSQMQGSEGGFYSSEDADSEGKEGQFYLWTQQEINELLDEEEKALFWQFYAAYEQGEFEGQLHLYRKENLDQQAQDCKKRIDDILCKLHRTRLMRPRPHCDEKILANWNALTISSLCMGYQITGHEKYLDASLRAANFILQKLISNGKLYHHYCKGLGEVEGFLDDYAACIQAFIDLYESTFQPCWLMHAQSLADAMIEKFWDDSVDAFSDSYSSHATPLIRTFTFEDGSTPSGNALEARALWKLSFFTREEYLKYSTRLLHSRIELHESPYSWYSYLIMAALAFANGPDELILSKSNESDSLDPFLKVIYSHYLPYRVLGMHTPNASDNSDNIEIFPDKKPILPHPITVYYCKGFECGPPCYSQEDLREMLQRFSTN